MPPCWVTLGQSLPSLGFSTTEGYKFLVLTPQTMAATYGGLFRIQPPPSPGMSGSDYKDHVNRRHRIVPELSTGNANTG